MQILAELLFEKCLISTTGLMLKPGEVKQKRPCFQWNLRTSFAAVISIDGLHKMNWLLHFPSLWGGLLIRVRWLQYALLPWHYILPWHLNPDTSFVCLTVMIVALLQ